MKLNLISSHYLILVLLIILGCENKTKEQKVIPVTEVTQELNIDDIATNIKEIPLEFSEQTMIGTITKVEFANGFIFVHDFTNARILKFDDDGRFIKEIGVKGEGPGEYKYLSSFAVDEKSKSVFLASPYKILKYDYEGHFIEEISGLDRVNSVSYLENELKIFSSKFGHQFEGSDQLFNLEILISLNNELKQKDSVVVKKIPVKSQMGTTFPMAKYFSGNPGDYFFYLPVLIPEKIIRDTLYSFNDNQLSFHTKINFQPFQNPESEQKAVNIKSMIKVGRYYIVNYLNQGEYTYFFDSEKQEGHIAENGIMADQYIMEERADLFPVLNRENQVYFTGKPIRQEKAKYEPNASVFLVDLK